MIRRTVEISSPSHLRVENEQLVIERDGQRLGQVPLEDLGVLVIDHPHATMSRHLLSSCARHDVTVVVSDEKHLPSAIVLPIEGHSVQAETMRAKAAMSEPTRKRLWQQVVRAKIAAQAFVLAESTNGMPTPLDGMGAKVRSGDPDNMEGQAARLYWPRMFGEEFRRDPDQDGINALLNYGYAIVRAATARAVCAAGLHPSLGLHHHNRYDALCLASDLMEPARPLVDRIVLALVSDGASLEVNAATKEALLTVVHERVLVDKREFPLLLALQTLAVSVRRVITEGKGRAQAPLPLPLNHVSDESSQD